MVYLTQLVSRIGIQTRIQKMDQVCSIIATQEKARNARMNPSQNYKIAAWNGLEIARMFKNRPLDHCYYSLLLQLLLTAVEIRMLLLDCVPVPQAILCEHQLIHWNGPEEDDTIVTDCCCRRDSHHGCIGFIKILVFSYK